MSISLPMIKYTYKDDGLSYDVVDVMKLYPEILNNTSWRDAHYQFLKACNQFHPYVFDIINELTRTPFGACGSTANIYMKIRYDEVKFNAGFYETTNLVYGYMAPVTFCDLIDFTAMFIPLFVFRFVYIFPYVVSRISPYIYVLNLASTKPLTMACFGHCIDSMITLFLMRKIVKLERKTEDIALTSMK